MEIDKNLLIQYASGMGAGLNPDPWVQNVDKITQQQLGAKSKFNLIELIRRTLAGDLGGESKVSADGKGLKLQFDPKSFESMFETESGKTGTMGAPRESSPGLLAQGLPGAQVPNVPTPTMPNLPAQQGGLNPSDSQPGTSVPSLAGLSSKDVSDALSGAINIEGLNQKKMTDLVDMMYKGALTGQARARTHEILRGEPLDRQFPIPHPEVGNLTLREWQSLPTEEREFASYVHAAKKLGVPKEELTREFFMTLEPTDKEQFLRATMNDPLLKAANLEALSTGATQVNVGERAFDAARARQRAYVMGPDLESDVRKELMKNGKAWRAYEESNKLSKSEGIPFNEAREHIQRRQVIEGIDKKIRSVFTDKKVEAELDGWYVDGQLVKRNPYYGK